MLTYVDIWKHTHTHTHTHTGSYTQSVREDLLDDFFELKDEKHARACVQQLSSHIAQVLFKSDQQRALCCGK